jgi:hypothetical protein
MNDCFPLNKLGHRLVLSLITLANFFLLSLHLFKQQARDLGRWTTSFVGRRAPWAIDDGCSRRKTGARDGRWALGGGCATWATDNDGAGRATDDGLRWWTDQMRSDVVFR